MFKRGLLDHVGSIVFYCEPMTSNTFLTSLHLIWFTVKYNRGDKHVHTTIVCICLSPHFTNTSKTFIWSFPMVKTNLSDFLSRFDSLFDFGYGSCNSCSFWFDQILGCICLVLCLISGLCYASFCVQWAWCWRRRKKMKKRKKKLCVFGNLFVLIVCCWWL